MDTGPPQFDGPAVDQQALAGVPLDAADAEGHSGLIQQFAAFGQGDAAGVEGGRILAPEPGVGHREGEVRPAARSHHPARRVQQFHRRQTAGSVHLNLYLGRIYRQGCDPDALPPDISLAAGVQPHRPVDAAAGIPAAAGSIGVVRRDSQGVGARVQLAVQRDRKGGVAIGVGGQRFSVQSHCGVAVYALKQHLAVGSVRRFKGLFVNVRSARKEGVVTAAGGRSATAFVDHRIVGQGDGPGGGRLLRLAEGPAAVEIQLFHLMVTPWLLSDVWQAG